MILIRSIVVAGSGSAVVFWGPLPTGYFFDELLLSIYPDNLLSVDPWSVNFCLGQFRNDRSDVNDFLRNRTAFLSDDSVPFIYVPNASTTGKTENHLLPIINPNDDPYLGLLITCPELTGTEGFAAIRIRKDFYRRNL